jgi:hypothetical protein
LTLRSVEVEVVQRELRLKQDLQGYAALMRQSSIEYHYEIYDASYCFMSGHCKNDPWPQTTKQKSSLGKPEAEVEQRRW